MIYCWIMENSHFLRYTHTHTHLRLLYNKDFKIININQGINYQESIIHKKWKNRTFLFLPAIGKQMLSHFMLFIIMLSYYQFFEQWKGGKICSLVSFKKEKNKKITFFVSYAKTVHFEIQISLLWHMIKKASQKRTSMFNILINDLLKKIILFNHCSKNIAAVELNIIFHEYFLEAWHTDKKYSFHLVT